MKITNFPALKLWHFDKVYRRKDNFHNVIFHVDMISQFDKLGLCS